MNNSFLSIESVTLTREPERDVTPELREREAKLVKLLASIREVNKSKDWSTLKEEVFLGLADRLNKSLLFEAKQESPDTLKLARLAGELFWAEHYDLGILEEKYKSELIGIRQQLHGKT